MEPGKSNHKLLQGEPLPQKKRNFLNLAFIICIFPQAVFWYVFTQTLRYV